MVGLVWSKTAADKSLKIEKGRLRAHDLEHFSTAKIHSIAYRLRLQLIHFGPRIWCFVRGNETAFYTASSMSGIIKMGENEGGRIIASVVRARLQL